MTARVQRRAQADDTRQRIFAAAVRLFAEHGYADTTVDKIARGAGVAKGTFFVHFATKDALVTELVRNQVRTARQKRDRTLARGGTPVDALRAAVISLGEQAGANRGLSRAVVSANMSNPVLGGFAESVFGGIISEMMDDVRAAQRAGQLARRADPETVAGTLITTYFGALLHFATAPNPKPLVALLQPVLDASLAGFAVLPGGAKGGGAKGAGAKGAGAKGAGATAPRDKREKREARETPAKAREPGEAETRNVRENHEAPRKPGKRAPRA